MHISSNLMDKDYGFREGFPDKELIKIHERTLLGAWILLLEKENKEDLISYYPMVCCLRIENNKVQTFDDKWKDFPQEEISKTIKYMPIEHNGIPTSWKKLTQYIKKK